MGSPNLIPTFHRLLTKYTPEAYKEIKAFTEHWEAEDDHNPALPLIPKLGFTQPAPKVFASEDESEEPPRSTTT